MIQKGQLEPLEKQLKSTLQPSPYTIDGSNVPGPKLPIVLTKKMVKSKWMISCVPAAVKPGFYFLSHCNELRVAISSDKSVI